MADVVVTLTGDEVSLFRSMQKIIDQQRKLDDGFKKNEQSSDVFQRIEKQLDGMGLNVAKNITALNAMTKAVEIGAKVWQDYHQARQEAIGTLNQNATPDQQLAQVAKPGELESLFREADAIAGRGKATREEARQLLFSAISENFREDIPTIERNAAVFPIPAQAQVAGQVRSLFKNDPMTAAQAISMTATAAGISRVDFDQIGTALPNAAEGISQINGNLAETLATVAMLSDDFATAQTAADRLKAFGSAAALDDKTKGRGLLGAFDAVSAMSPDDRADFLGKSQELNAIYTAMQNNIVEIRKLNEQLIADRAATAAGGGTAAAQVAEAANSPTMAARNQLAAAQAQAEIARERNLAVGGAAAETARLMAEANADLKQMGPWERWINSTAASVFSQISSDPGEVVSNSEQMAAVFAPWNSQRSNAALAEGRARALVGLGLGSENDRALVQRRNEEITWQFNQSLGPAADNAKRLADELDRGANAAAANAQRNQAAAAGRP